MKTIKTKSILNCEWKWSSLLPSIVLYNGDVNIKD